VDFIKRIMKYGACSKCCVVVGLMYLDKLKRSDSSVRLTSFNFQRLLLVSIMTAAKFFEDEYYSNRHWAEIGGLTVQELNSLELEFLFRMAFNLNVKRDQYEAFVNQIRDGAQQLAEARRRAMSAPKQQQLASKRPTRSASRGEQQQQSHACGPTRHTEEGDRAGKDGVHSKVKDCAQHNCTSEAGLAMEQVRAVINDMKQPSRSNSECSLCTTTSPRSRDVSPEASMDVKLIKAAAVHSSD
jgi:hypothetical protein